MRIFTLTLFFCVGVTMGCQPGDTEPNECEEGDERSCGSSPCRGIKQCVDGEWSECSSVGTDCGECCVCDEEMHTAFDCSECQDRDDDGFLTLECGGDDCDDQDYRVYPESWDECDGIDNDCNGVVDDDESIQECGSIDVCEGWRFCVDGEVSECSSEGRDCGPCCRCDADGNEVIDCGICEDGRGETCGEDICQGFRVCIGDEWSNCSTEGNDCGPCCRCDAAGLPGETCEGCEAGYLIECGEGLCTDMRICSEGEYTNCGSMGISCGECCECDENGNEQSICDTCEDGDIELCGSGDCRGYHICYSDVWESCSTEGEDCGHCCTCDASGIPRADCTTCEEGEARVCGSGACLGFQVCVSDSWSTCSTVLRDCGTCCSCDSDGNEIYDDTQDYDCPDFDCPSYSGCDYGWAYCGGSWGYHLYVELIAHRVGGACSGIDSCGHEECYPSEWKFCESDSDGDHYTESCGDCNDADPLIHPAYIEVCGDFVDNNCNGTIEEGCCLDWDGDGHIDGTCGGTDCDDSDPTVYPGAPVDCSGGDNNCDGLIDRDADSDGHLVLACGGDDCNDSDPTVYPGAPADCSGDADCDGLADADEDSDFHFNIACGGDDCDDTNASIHPGALEICDGHDNDCDGTADNPETWSTRHTTIRNVIPTSKCSGDPCCGYTTHRELGLAYEISITAPNFSAINPANIYLTVDVDRLYYSNTAYSDARVEYRVDYTGSGTLTQGYNFRSPAHSACGSLYSTPGATNPFTFTTTTGDLPTNVAWWVPAAGDYGVSLKNFSVEISMSCY
jgi:hypothetical protein